MRGNNFTLEHFDENRLEYKINATAIRYIEEDSIYRLSNYNLRRIGIDDDSLVFKRRLDTLLGFDLQDLTPPMYVAETLTAS